MEYDGILAYLASLNPIVPVIFAGLGMVVVAAQAFVALTPTPADDNFMAKIDAIPVLGAILRGLRKFAPIGKK